MKIKIDSIEIDQTQYVRDGVNADLVSEYAERKGAGDSTKAEAGGQPPAVQVATSGNLPASVVGKDGKHYRARRRRGAGGAVRRPSRPTGRGTLAQLQRHWRIATQEDRAAFMNWVHGEELIENHRLDAAEPPDDGHSASRDEQDESGG